VGEKLKNLEFQKLFQEYTFLSIDEEYKKEFIVENNGIFISAIKKLISEEPNLNDLIHPKNKTGDTTNQELPKEYEQSDVKLFLDSPEYKFNVLDWFLNKDKGGEIVIYSEKFNDKFIDDDLFKKKVTKEADTKTMDRVKSLFRKIAKKTHPDKTGTNQFSDMYIKAKKASETYDLYELYSICIKLGITYEIEDLEKEELKMKIGHKKDELSKIETAFVWVWMHTTDEQAKKQLLRVFLMQHGLRFKSFF
jgi:hypothetical protein